jgi:hypothetical protein
MSYTTGSAATTGEILAALAGFLTTDGWTINRNTTGANRTGSILQVTSGQCAFAIANETFTSNIWPNYVLQSAQLQDRFKMAIATSISAGVATYWGHTGSLVTSDSDADRVLCNLLPGPYTYFFMSKGSVAGRYCHVIISVSGDVFCHFSFGNIDQKAFSHSGAAYCTSQSQLLFPTATTPASSNHDRVNYQNVPFGGNDWGNASGLQALLYAPNALPGGWAVHRNVAALMETHFMDAPAPDSISVVNRSFLNARALYDGPLPFSGVTPLFPFPVVTTEGSLACWVGEFPDVRQCNMTGLVPGQEVAFGSDTWKVFPAVKVTPWGQQLTLLPSSGRIGIAYKKIV